MQVIATAGHVDHGKSALVRALTEMEPDRWAEEQRRGLTIDLGFAWTKLPDGKRVAFVDVPGHERFVPNMLAGLGPVPAVLFVVAADGGWMPQSAEHLAAIDAIGIRHGVLAVTRSDLADPGPATRQALDRVSPYQPGRRGGGGGERGHRRRAAGTAERAGAAGGGAARPDPAAPVRLWVDRSFSIRGSGTVVTGTLPAGTVTAGQELLLTPSLRPARIRGLESLNEPVTSAAGVARVALNLRGIPADVPARGMALIEAGRWTLTRLLDVRLSQPAEMTLPAEITLHIGSARTQARIRPLGPLGSSPIARLTLRDALPLHVGDRVLLRDPGSAGVAILGATVLDVAPPALTKRGAAAAAGTELATWPALPRPPTCCAGTASCVPARWPPWASPAARRRWRGTGSPTRTAGRPAPSAGRSGRRPRHARPAGHRHAARGRPRRARPARPGAGRGAGPGAGPARGWLPAAPRGEVRPRRHCRRAWPRRCGPSWPTSRGRRSWPRKRGGCGNWGSTRERSPPPRGPACCCG